MAAGMIYTIGGSFWEFGGPDLERAKLFVMLGTAEDHHSNPLKIAISKFKRDGGRFVSINPVRTGYSAIADEWVPIRPGTDGALLLALNHEIIAQGLFDREFVARYTNGGQLVIADPGSPRHGLLATDEDSDPGNPLYPQNQLWWDRHSNRPVISHTPGADPRLFGEYRLTDGTHVQPAFQLLAQKARAALAGIVRGEKGLACLRHQAIAAEAARAIRGGEAECVLGMVGHLRIAGRHRLLHQALDEPAGGGMPGEKARKRIGIGPAAGLVGELSPEELEQLLGRPRDEPFDRVGEDVGVLPVGEMKLDGHRAYVGGTIVHLGVSVGIGEPDGSRY